MHRLGSSEEVWSSVFQDLFLSLLSPLLSSDPRMSQGLAEVREGNSGSSNFSLTNVEWVGGRRGGKSIPNRAWCAVGAESEFAQRQSSAGAPQGLAQPAGSPDPAASPQHTQPPPTPPPAERAQSRAQTSEHRT